LEWARLRFSGGPDLPVAVAREPVDTPGDSDAPPPPLHAMHHVHLGAVVGVLSGAQLRAAAVDVLPDPHAPEAVAALHADAAVGRLVDQVADAADDLALLVIDAHATMVAVLRVVSCVLRVLGPSLSSGSTICR